MHDKELVLGQYATKQNLQTRVDIHRLYSQIPISFHDWAMSHFEFSGTERALDAGCGSGAWLFPLADRLSRSGGSVVGVDLSEGMLTDIANEAKLRTNIDLITADVQELPFDDDSFDFVMANFMLYHVPDISRAIQELKRVLKPGGKLMTATNSQWSMRPLWELHVACQRKANIPEHIILRSVPNIRFSLENGSDFLRTHFEWFELTTLYDALRFSDSQPLMDYYSSGFMKHGDIEHEVSDEQWKLVYHLVREHVDAAIATHGFYSVPKTGGFFTMKKS